MNTIRTEPCRTCRGTGNDPSQATVRTPCSDCGATGRRYVPTGYTQADIDQVRHLVDAMAVAQESRA